MHKEYGQESVIRFQKSEKTEKKMADAQYGPGNNTSSKGSSEGDGSDQS